MTLALLPASETQWICQRARQLGFALSGVAPAERFPELLKYPEWLERGYAGEMKYLSDSRRLDPRQAMPGVRSLIVCGLNYNSRLPYSTESQAADQRPRGWISRYAWGQDYHQVLWEKLNSLVREMKVRFADTADFCARAYSDTGPIHERAAAKYAGLGWLGKNTLLISQTAGSWLFLGTILTTVPLTPTLGADVLPPADRCGSCRACIDACPTKALVEPYVLDATRCIAYLTIEFKGEIPLELREPVGRHVFGCDICQDVCPWNRKSPRTDASPFEPRVFRTEDGKGGLDRLYMPDLARLANLSEEAFRENFRGSPVKRAKWRGLLRNACIALGNADLTPGSAAHREALAALGRLSEAQDPAVSGSARWALSRIQSLGDCSSRAQERPAS